MHTFPAITLQTLSAMLERHERAALEAELLRLSSGLPGRRSPRPSTRPVCWQRYVTVRAA